MSLNTLIDIIIPIIVYFSYNYYLKFKLIGIKRNESNKINESISINNKVKKIFNHFFLSKYEKELYNLAITNLVSIYRDTKNIWLRLAKLSIKGYYLIFILLSFEFLVKLIIIMITGSITNYNIFNFELGFGLLILYIISIFSFILAKPLLIENENLFKNMNKTKLILLSISLLPIVILITLELRVVLALFRIIFSNKQDFKE